MSAKALQIKRPSESTPAVTVDLDGPLCACALRATAERAAGSRRRGVTVLLWERLTDPQSSCSS